MRKAQLLASALALGLFAMPFTAGPTAAAGLGDTGYAATQVAAAQTLPYSYRNLQQLLNDLGYNVGTPDGAIGAKSRTAIRAFQTDNGLPTSGEPSRALFDSVQAAWLKRFGGQQVAAQPTQPAQQPAAQLGSDPQLVMDIQEELRERGYNVPLSGQADTATVSAIRDYQRGARITVNGQASESLLASLQAAPRGGTARFSQQQIMTVQSSLNDLGYNAGPEDGVPGPRLREAIRLYQTREGLQPTGEISTALIDSLQGDAGTSTTATAVARSTPEASQLQLENLLSQRGYNVGVVDGKIDAKTQAGITQYQKDYGLKVTGKSSSSLLAHLQGNTAAPVVSASVIKSIESALDEKGYKVGPIDGKLDSKTQAAISAYQRHAGLVQNGQPSQALLDNIESSSVTAKSGTVGDVINTFGSLIQR